MSRDCGNKLASPAEIRAMLGLPDDGLLRVRIPAALLSEAARIATAQGMTLSEFARRAVAEALVAVAIRERGAAVRLAGEREFADGQAKLQQAIMDGRLRLAKATTGTGD